MPELPIMKPTRIQESNGHAMLPAAPVKKALGEALRDCTRKVDPPKILVPKDVDNQIIKIIPVPPPELGEAAYHGPVGDFMRAIAPYTEATDTCLLAHFLPAVGTLVGPKVHVWAGNKQAARINVGIVGPTNSGRKGTGFGPVERLMEIAAGDFWRSQHVGGLSSGEGLIQKVSDTRVTSEDGKVEYVPVEKRLLVVEQELSRVLANIKREGNILSQIIREAFDSGNLATLTVNPRHAFGAHISIVGHITPEELTERLDHVDMANGFGNRFMWFLVRSDKMLPFTDPIPARLLGKFAPRLEALVDFGAGGEGRPAELSPAAKDRWEVVYPTLREDCPGIVGAMTARGAPMVLRTALIYALLECDLKKKVTIEVEHLDAALAVWKYSEQSVHALFQRSKTGDKLQDKLLQLLSHGPMTKGDFNKHLSKRQKDRVSLALVALETAELVTKMRVTHDGAGRPAERWELATPPRQLF